MLKLVNISKTYVSGEVKTQALKEINLQFRKNEFVSILGPSGCGKTTMLNIIGGLDKYTFGDLIINGVSTKEYKDKDWDKYRNHSIGFVFQSYNLIPHQTVLENVQLALTLSGISKEESKKRAIKVLTRVGLKDKLNNKPSQLSGGQMQRVAIARALVNDPEIILADEPTGALDSKSSVQIMNLLKEISKDKLIIMVTHNADIANEYSSRIVNLLDGEVISDTNPYIQEEDIKEDKLLSVSNDEDLTKSQLRKKNKKKRMSFFTALSLSFKNLLTKKGRTILVTFAGSIGIIGIALILAISSGFSTYVDRTQQDTLSTYPITIQTDSYNLAGLMQIFMSDNDDGGIVLEDGKVHTKNELTEMLSKFNSSTSQNNLNTLKSYLDTPQVNERLLKYASAIQYDYNLDINAYLKNEKNGLVPVNSTEIFNDVIKNYAMENPGIEQNKKFKLLAGMFSENATFSVFSSTFWSEMLDNQKMLEEQYELVGEGSHFATEYNEIMIVVDENYKISDYTLFALGLLEQSKLESLLDNYIKGEDSNAEETTFSYEELLNTEYKIITKSSYFVKNESTNLYENINDFKQTNPERYESELNKIYEDDSKTITLKVAGILREKPNTSAHSITTNISYTSKLTEYIIDFCLQSEVIKAQMASPETSVITGQNFADSSQTSQEKVTYNSTLSQLGYIDIDTPYSIKIYPKDFQSKTEINIIIEEYNNKMISENKQENIITYSDTIGTMMSTISTIISAITYVLIAFVGVSLVVSSIMIGIITYISVLERTKEIGILRSVGASKRDVSRVFTAESFIIGLSSGLFGILVSVIFIIPINIILKSFTDIAGLASLPIIGGIVLVLISIILTLIAGFIPSKLAAKKDPVVALREM